MIKFYSILKTDVCKIEKYTQQPYNNIVSYQGSEPMTHEALMLSPQLAEHRYAVTVQFCSDDPEFMLSVCYGYLCCY